MARKGKIKISPYQVADVVNRALLEDSLVLAGTQRGQTGSVEDFDVDERMRKAEEGEYKGAGKRKTGTRHSTRKTRGKHGGRAKTARTRGKMKARAVKARRTVKRAKARKAKRATRAKTRTKARRRR